MTWKIIDECKYGIHDISKTNLDTKTNLPRFNMPFELGLFLRARNFGPRDQNKKRCIFLDKDQYRYQKFISDIAGQDIHSRGSDQTSLMGEIAKWLRDQIHDQRVPGGVKISTGFQEFSKALPKLCAAIDFTTRELTFRDFVRLSAQWIASPQPGGD